MRRRESIDSAARDRFGRVWPPLRHPDAASEPQFPEDETSGMPGVVLMPSAGSEPDAGAPRSGVGRIGYGFHDLGADPGSDGPDPRWPAPPVVEAEAAGLGSGRSAVLAAFSPGRRAIKALAVVGILVVGIAAFVAWHSQPHPETVPPNPSSSGTSVGEVSATVPAGPGGSGSPSPSASVAMIVVAVTGRVRHPGLVSLPPGSRVADAIAAAGGALPGTDLSFINLARKVSDGELIVIGVQPSPGMTADPTGDPSAAPAAGGAPAGPVNLNTAGLTQLETLPGIGPELAQRIIDYRTQHGAFHSVDELQDVPGIGPEKFAEIKDLVTT